MAEWVRADRSLTLIAEGGSIELERLDEAGLEWLATGPAGEAPGALRDALMAVAAVGVDHDWIDAVVEAGRSLIAVPLPRAPGPWARPRPGWCP